VIVNDAKSLFRDYVDDPDGTFLTDAQVIQYLDFGIQDWFSLIRVLGPSTVMKSVILSAASNTAYSDQPASSKPFRYSLDLNDKDILYPSKAANTPLMGSYLDGGTLKTGPIDQILNLSYIVSGTNERQDRCIPLPSNAQIPNSSTVRNYALDKYVLQFAGTPPENFVIDYFPVPATDFSAGTDNIEGGDLAQFHELIVLYATRRYAIRDGVISQPVEGMIQLQESRIVRFLQDQRLVDSGNQVRVTQLF
tara:strand:- start:2715 stop:3464 length:750 start_codon:yes stop_codon:yes gene_type:complete